MNEDFGTGRGPPQRREGGGWVGVRRQNCLVPDEVGKFCRGPERARRWNERACTESCIPERLSFNKNMFLLKL